MSSKPNKNPPCNKLKKIIKDTCGSFCGDDKSTQVVEPITKTTSSPIITKNLDNDDDKDSQGVDVLCPDYTVIARSPKISGSIAIVKDSDDPSGDFRRSMLQMIMEKGIYSEDDLQELLNCFLRMNPNHLHDVIIQAFSEIVSDVNLSPNIRIN